MCPVVDTAASQRVVVYPVVNTVLDRVGAIEGPCRLLNDTVPCVLVVGKMAAASEDVARGTGLCGMRVRWVLGWCGGK